MQLHIPSSNLLLLLLLLLLLFTQQFFLQLGLYSIEWWGDGE